MANATKDGSKAGESSVFKVLIKGKQEAVWREITKLDEPQGCFFNSVMHTDGLRPGGQLRMRSVSGKLTAVVGRIVEFDPPRRFAHTLRFTNENDPECTVVYDLRPTADGIEFTLTIENLPVGTKSADQMTRGGPMIVKTLKTIVEKGRPSFGVRVMYWLMGAMEFMAPKSMRSENWPLDKKL